MSARPLAVSLAVTGAFTVLEFVGGILEERCGGMLKDFFAKVRVDGMGKPGAVSGRP